MSDFFYYLSAAGESALSVFGIRAPYEQPRYEVIGHLADGVEIRAYAARMAVQTPVRRGNDGEAFGRLFRYITGANGADAKIAMTVPVEQTARPIPMTIPVETLANPGGKPGSDDVMRFFLPRAVAERGPPKPADPLVSLVTLPPQQFAVLRFSGTVDDASRALHEQRLIAAVTGAGRHAAGSPSLLSYDPPFALPFLRRNEVAVVVGK
jgi:hypothetical protein